LILPEPSAAAILAAMDELRESGVEPDVWKVQGLDDAEDCRAVAATARTGGREGVRCIVLGAGASVDDCRRWLASAAAGGYAGFAVGRTLWAEEVRAFLAGELDRDAAAARIGDNYRSMAEAYASGYRGTRTAPP